DEQGELLAEVSDLLLLPLAGSQQRAQSATDWVYDLAWRSLTLPTGETSASGSWLIIPDRGGYSERVVHALSARGEQVVVARTQPPLLADDELVASFGAMLSEAAAEFGERWRGVIYLRGLDGAPFEEHTAASLMAEQAHAVGGLLGLVKALGQARPAANPRLWIMTRGAQAVAGNEVAPSMASLWGFGRVLAREFAELRGTLVDLDPADDDVAPLVNLLVGGDGEDQIALRYGQPLVCRLVQRQFQKEQRSLAWRPDGAYLITGGLGGLGLEIARSMIQQGARRLILLGRTQLPERARWQEVSPMSHQGRLIAAVRELESLGASIHIASVDITVEGELAAFLEGYRREGWPSIRGVVHAAGVLQDQLLSSMSLDDLHKVLRPKIVGAWELHGQLRDEPLDFFVLFSSIAAVLGSIGQSNYAAGNAFLDALAHYRHSQGLSAQSINWGPWSEVGMAARNGVNDQLAANGIDAFSPAQGQQLFSLLLADTRPQNVALAASWQRWPRVGGSALVSELLAQFGEDQATIQPSNATVSRELLDLPEAERKPYLETYLRQLVARILGLDLAEVTVVQPINTLGLDSIMALELKNSIAADTGVVLPLVAILQGPSIGQFADYILGEIRPASESDELERMLAEMEAMSLDEARDLLGQIS
ncbi:MAG: SDR family NAD(P)-dependent oxidoreductase, partial [Chloroflexi bacterium]|nr:SDR family NAD(P)-dependent oxidoreductase [Chloroflexota bacterium]